MKTIVITPETEVPNEIITCNQLLGGNLHRLHVRKPRASEDDLRNYLDQLDSKYLNKVCLHDHHHLVNEYGLGGKHFKSDQQIESQGTASKSFHSPEDAESETASLVYGFLSPVYNSISKPAYRSKLDRNALKKWLHSFDRFPIYALGGIQVSRLTELLQLNFSGVALMGGLWSESESRQRIKTAETFIHA